VGVKKGHLLDWDKNEPFIFGKFHTHMYNKIKPKESPFIIKSNNQILKINRRRRRR
jgi:hypothetical protein